MELEKKSGRGTDKPNIIFGNDAHVCWDKFTRYFDVDARKVPIDKDKRTITAEAVSERINENTICVGCVLGTTFTGEIDPVKEINDLLLEYKKKKKAGTYPSISMLQVAASYCLLPNRILSGISGWKE